MPAPPLKPPSLQPGDTIGIVAPASNVKRDELDAGCDALRKLGYRPFYSASILERDLYFAGAAKRRLTELHEMFAADEVRAIICARGGYGSNYLLGELETALVAAHPKILMGYSDITTLLTRITDATGLVTFHGPMVAKDFAVEGGVDLSSWQAAISGQAEWTSASGGELKALVEGVSEGILYGGCLSMLVASLGTPYEVRTAGTILFIEDVATKPFQIDRMLMHLKLAGKLEDVCGIVFGEMIDCVQSRDQDYTLEQVISRVVGDLGVPVAFGLRSGHVSRGNVTLPIGVRAKLTVAAGKVELKVLESATQPVAVPSKS